MLKKRSRDTGLALAALIFSEALVDVLDGAAATVVIACGFVVAVLAKTLLYWRDVDGLVLGASAVAGARFGTDRCCLGGVTDCVSVRAL